MNTKYIMQNVIQHNNLSQPVYDRLKKMIQKGELAPGQKLVQERLATALGVSRTPLLKALQMLEHEMIVESIPRRGMYVREISLQEMIDVYDCREAIESTAVKLVIERATDTELSKLKEIFEPFAKTQHIHAGKYRKADEKFHDMIVELSKNPVLQKMSSVSDIYKLVYQYGLIRPPEETMIEHALIIKAILNRDLESADRALRNHISLSRQKLAQRQQDKSSLV
ncbi:MAG: GntR family transcriptional regulator [Saprospiraceae bacterium]|nr:GntR family transcriptional regulator [Saprospiraceae bacterium]